MQSGLRIQECNLKTNLKTNKQAAGQATLEGRSECHLSASLPWHHYLLLLRIRVSRLPRVPSSLQTHKMTSERCTGGRIFKTKSTALSCTQTSALGPHPAPELRDGSPRRKQPGAARRRRVVAGGKDVGGRRPGVGGTTAHLNRPPPPPAVEPVATRCYLNPLSTSLPR